VLALTQSEDESEVNVNEAPRGVNHDVSIVPARERTRKREEEDEERERERERERRKMRRG
jgi:hypothetical protein